VHLELKKVLLVTAILKFPVEQIANLLDKTYFDTKSKRQNNCEIQANNLN